ncbi:helix-turn-helix domain-containing protein [Phenylobacterium sp.]|uniref:winged helix-turn-helix transcriptional regulator n=1 Tax=Phenylobacterium sp. TaxID=1871053 RepID=UPI0025F53169|nr:helix-turn-helix domain-containing protein [Phenylobacterium sp.]
MAESHAIRSGCPINLTLEILGDRWSLLVLRDMMFGNRRHFRELLGKSEEGIASNILADRLKRLMAQGMITRADDPTHKQKAIYSLTEKAIQLVPVMALVGAWGRRHLSVSEELSIRAQLLEEGGPSMWDAFMDELRRIHLGATGEGRSVLEELQTAYLAVVAKNEAARALARDAAG